MALFWNCSQTDPCKAFVPDLVTTLMCAPLLLPCVTSYIEALTEISWMASGGGVGKAWPIAPYTDVLVWMAPPAPKFSPVFRTKRFSPTWLVEFPLNKLFVLV